MKKTLLTLSMAIVSYCSYAQSYLPLTAGNSYPLTNDLFVKNAVHYLVGSTEYGIQFANAGALGNEAYQGTYWYVGTGSGSTATERMRITNGGNVGIGTTSPSAVLQITNSQDAALRLQSTSGGNLSFQQTQYYSSWFGLTHPYILQSIEGSGTSDMVLTPVTNNPTSGLVIKAGGNVGIGTASPGYKLDVNGTVNGTAASFTSFNINNSSTIAPVMISSSGQSTGLEISTTSTDADFLGYDRTNSLFKLLTFRGSQFTFTPSDNTAYRMTLDGTGNLTVSGTGNSLFAGNVGIGTTTPDTKLAVNGTIHSKEVKVDLTSWPDYVFKPAYKLPSLLEVKNYIDENQHLPDMPSETEVAKNGINLGEMNKILVKKVEELTLYQIEQQEKGKQQDARIVTLEKALSKLIASK
jgi:hypothetical protein